MDCNLLLSNCYQNALELAEKNMINPIAFHSISTGAFNFPFEEATRIEFDTILQEVEVLKHLQKIKFVFYSG